MRLRSLLVCSCLSLAPGCGGDPAADGDADPDDDADIAAEDVARGAVALPPLDYTLSLSYNSPFPVRPATLTGHLYLEVARNGAVSGLISAREAFTVSLSPVSGRVSGRAILFEDIEVAFTPGGRLEFDELRLRLRDRDRDGEVDGASGEGTGRYSRIAGDTIDETLHTSVLNGRLDTTATTASLFVPRNTPTVLPYESVEVVFLEALREEDVRDHLRLLAGGRPVAGQLATVATEGLVTGAFIQPDDFLPFGEELTVDVGGLADPSGNDLAASTARLSVAEDAGLLAESPGFESGLDGWISLGAAVEGSFQGFAPAEGAAQAVVRENSTLAAALDVGADATTLDLSVIVLSEIGEVDADRTTVIALRTAGGGAVEIFDVADVAADQQPCTTCTDYGRFVGPLRRSADLTPFRGQRVFLTIDVRSSFFIGVNFFAALVDDIQLR